MAVLRTSSSTPRIERTPKPPANAVQLPKAQKDGFAFLPSPSNLLGAIKQDLRFPWPGKGCSDQIGWLQKVQPPTHDVTSQFESLDEKAKAGQPVLPPEAKDYVYLSVPGVTSGAVPDPFYMDSNLDALKDAGCETARAPVNTFDGVEANAKILKDTIEKYAAEGKKVVLVCHSMGGLDAAAALSLYPELKDDVRAMVTIQSPYGGSPVAQDTVTNPVLKSVAGAAMDLLGGSGKAFTDLTYDARQAFVAAHPMPPGIPTVCMASSRASPFSTMFATQEYLKSRYGLASDGMVSPADAFIPGAQTVTLQGLDHLETTGTEIDPFAAYHPADLTLGLVALALKAPPLPASGPVA
jgi:pimeloyl-ACP methyl ester carboxylesterase